MRNVFRPTGAPAPISTASTYHDNPEQYVREMPISSIPPVSAPLTAPTPGLITEVEHAAEVVLEVGEAVSEGLSPWALASHLIGILAAGARVMRARRVGLNKRRVVSSERRRVAGVEFEMVLCPAGEFWMGSEEGVGHDWEHPRHRVRISQPFLIGQTQVTQELWEKVMGSNPSEFKGASLPVENISWYDAVRFCNALSGLENLRPVYEIGTGDEPTVSLDPTANGYRLPTEAQWEYAAKAGTELVYAGSSTLDAVAWHSGNAGGKTHPVGEKTPNAWGIYDMSGNVEEWCADQWDGEAYKSRSGTVTDPAVYAAGTAPRVVRGGCWWLDADLCRVASRDWNVTAGGDLLGMRLLRCNLG